MKNDNAKLKCFEKELKDTLTVTIHALITDTKIRKKFEENPNETLKYFGIDFKDSEVGRRIAAGLQEALPAIDPLGPVAGGVGAIVSVVAGAGVTIAVVTTGAVEEEMHTKALINLQQALTFDHSRIQARAKQYSIKRFKLTHR